MIDIFRLALATLSTALLGLSLAAAVSIVVLFLRAAYSDTTRWIFPVFLICYALPPSVVVIIGLALNLDKFLEISLVVLSLSFPTTLIAVQAWDRALISSRRFPTGRRIKRASLVAFPGILPEILNGLATCIPWALLSSMLSEIAVSNRTGLGVSLWNSMQQPLSYSVPFIVAAVLCSVVPYTALLFLAWLLRKNLNLQWQPHDALLAEPFRRLSALVEFTLIVSFVVVVWFVSHLCAPILAPDATRIRDAIAGSPNEIFSSLFYTVLITIVAVSFGILFGILLALISHVYSWMKWTSSAVLLPLQILPLIVFAPLLFRLNRFIEDIIFPGTIPPADSIISLIPSFLVTFLIAVLATAYVGFNISASELSRLPTTRGGIIEALSPRNVRRLRFIELPWCIGVVPLIAEIAMPRALLAVLVVEFLVTGQGLGGYFSRMRAASSHKEAWATLLLMFFAIALLSLITNAVSRYYSTGERKLL